MEKEVALHFTAKACHSGGVKRDPLLKGPLQLTGHDRNIFLHAKGVKKGKPDKFHILLIHECHNLFVLIHIHIQSSFYICI